MLANAARLVAPLFFLAACSDGSQAPTDAGVDGALSAADLAGADLIGVDLASIPTGDAGATLAPGDQTLTIQINGTDRSVLIHVPSGGGPMPLVLALHGNGDT